MFAGLLLATIGLLEPSRSVRLSSGTPGHVREVMVISGLLFACAAGSGLLVLLGQRDPFVPDEKYYGLISKQPSGGRSGEGSDSFD